MVVDVDVTVVTEDDVGSVEEEPVSEDDEPKREDEDDELEEDELDSVIGGSGKVRSGMDPVSIGLISPGGKM